MAHAEELREQVAPSLFQDFDVTRFPNSTIGALALANRAYRTSPEVGERVSFALRNALFEEGRDISEDATLEQLAHDHGTVLPDASDRTGARAGGVACSVHPTSSVATPTRSALRWTSPRTRCTG
jgi:hypothetical protein